MSKNPTKIVNVEDVLKNRKNIGLSCIYFLIENSKIVYVGQSKNGGFDRIGAHLKYSDKSFDSYYVQLCDINEINELEADYILKFSPLLNKNLPGNKKYKSILSMSKKYKQWNMDRFVSTIKSNGIQIYNEKYVESKLVDSIFKTEEQVTVKEGHDMGSSSNIINGENHS